MNFRVKRASSHYTQKESPAPTCHSVGTRPVPNGDDETLWETSIISAFDLKHFVEENGSIIIDPPDPEKHETLMKITIYDDFVG